MDPVIRIENAEHAPRADLLHIAWTIDRFCNYSCSYCWKDSHSSVRNGLSTPELIAGYSIIRDAAWRQGLRSFSWAISGGEATLHPGFLDLIRAMIDDVQTNGYVSFIMVSNMSNGPRWWSSFVDLASGFDKLTVSASWHREQAKDRQAFADKCLSLVESRTQCGVTIVMDPSIFDHLMDDATYFHGRGLSVHVRIMRDPITGMVASGYDDRMMKVLNETRLFRDYGLPGSRRPRPFGRFSPDDPSQIMVTRSSGATETVRHPDHLAAMGMTRFVGWGCRAGQTSIAINEKGDVYRGWGCNDISLGNIKHGVDLLDSPRECVSARGCACSHDLAIPKQARIP